MSVSVPELCTIRKEKLDLKKNKDPDDFVKGKCVSCNDP